MLSTATKGMNVGSVEMLRALSRLWEREKEQLVPPSWHPLLHGLYLWYNVNSLRSSVSYSSPVCQLTTSYLTASGVKSALSFPESIPWVLQRGCC